MKNYRTFLFVLLTVFISGCSQKRLEEITNAGAIAVTLVIAIPVIVVYSPVILAKFIKERRDSKLKEVKINGEDFVELGVDVSKADIKLLLGEPTNKYACIKPKFEIWEYDFSQLKDQKYIVFGEDDLIQFYPTTWKVSDTCYQVTS